MHLWYAHQRKMIFLKGPLLVTGWRGAARQAGQMDVTNLSQLGEAREQVARRTGLENIPSLREEICPQPRFSGLGWVQCLVGW